jgi:hypothetical protein
VQVEVSSVQVSTAAEEPKFMNESVRAGYQASMTMAAAEGNMLWQKIQTFVVTNSLLLVGILGFKDQADRGIRTSLSVLGIAIALLWLVILGRSWAMYNYWLGWARNVERSDPAFKDAHVRLMCDSRAMLGLSHAFAPAYEEEIKVSGLARIVSVRVSTYLTVVSFGAVHLWLLLR